MNPEDQRDYDSYKKLLDRVGKAISMSSDTEVTEIIRRRLFEWHGISDDMKRTVAAYAEWATGPRLGVEQPWGRLGRRPLPDVLPVPPERHLGLRAEMAEPSPVPEDPRDPPAAWPSGFRGPTGTSTRRLPASRSSRSGPPPSTTRRSATPSSSNSARTSSRSP